MIDKQLIIELQGLLGVEQDGILGNNTLRAAIDLAKSINPPTSNPIPPQTMEGVKVAWGAKVSKEFKARVLEICRNLGMPFPHGADWLMSCMAFESGGTFRSDIKNAAGSNATGLIQFMPTTAGILGTTTQELAAMSPERQLDYVERYFKPYKNRLTSLEDVYMAILWPVAVGKPNGTALFVKDLGRSKAYLQNAGLDSNRDGIVTKEEAVSKVRNMMAKGISEGYMG